MVWYDIFTEQTINENASLNIYRIISYAAILVGILIFLMILSIKKEGIVKKEVYNSVRLILLGAFIANLTILFNKLFGTRISK